MNIPEPQAVTALLQRWSGGDAQALEELASTVHTELRLLARRYLRHERNNHQWWIFRVGETLANYTRSSKCPKTGLV